MRPLGAISTRHPRSLVAVWLVIVAVFASAGIGVEDELHRSALTVPGTGS